MSKANELPIAVQNLRQIWAVKKVEMEFNQTEAAKELGWSQGAISHYLNNIKDLGAAAVVKLANFLNVDPTEIDPAIVSKLPNVRKIEVFMKSSDVTAKHRDLLYCRDDIESFYVEVEETAKIHNADHTVLVDSDVPGTGYAKLCKPAKYKDNKLIAVRLKGTKNISFYLKTDPPPPKTIHTLWAVVSILYQ